MTQQARPGWLLPLVVAAGVALIATGWWRAGQRAEVSKREAEGVREVQAVLEEFRKGLPREYAPGLRLEAVHFEGQDLVMTIRSLGRNVADAGPELQQVAQGEKALMLPLCDNGDVIYLLARGVTLKRRFVDRQDRIFFEITLASADCAR